MGNVLEPVTSVAFVVGFVLGALATWGCYRAADDIHNRRTGDRRRTRIKATWAAGGLLAVFIAWSSVSTWQSGIKADEALHRAEAVAADAVTIANNQRECFRQFTEALSNRAVINAQDTELRQKYDELSADQRDALAAWLKELLEPPADMAALDSDDPVRADWAAAVTRKYLAQIETAQAQQRVLAARAEELANERAAHPYPEPTCGK